MNGDIPAEMTARGEALVAEGIDLAAPFGQWVDEVFDHERTIAASSGADSPALTADESDAVGGFWSSLCRAPELHDVAEWIETHAHRVNHGRRVGEEPQIGDLAYRIGWTLEAHQ